MEILKRRKISDFGKSKKYSKKNQFSKPAAILKFTEQLFRLTCIVVYKIETKFNIFFLHIIFYVCTVLWTNFSFWSLSWEQIGQTFHLHQKKTIFVYMFLFWRQKLVTFFTCSHALPCLNVSDLSPPWVPRRPALNHSPHSLCLGLKWTKRSLLP